MNEERFGSLAGMEQAWLGCVGYGDGVRRGLERKPALHEFTMSDGESTGGLGRRRGEGVRGGFRLSGGGAAADR